MSFKVSFLFFFLAACSLRTAAASFSSNHEKRLAPDPIASQVTRQFARLLPTYHLRQAPLDDAISASAWTNYLNALDYDHVFFLQSDIAAFATNATLIDDQLREGNTQFAYDVFHVFKQRLNERCAKVDELLDKGFDFNVPEEYMWKRKDAPWPASREEQDELWRRRVKNEYLGHHLSRQLAATNGLARAGGGTNGVVAAGHPPFAPTNAPAAVAAGNATNAPPLPTAEEFVRKRYRQFQIVIDDSDADWVLQRYLGAVAGAYDPHSMYMAPATVEDFNIDMNLSLCGIGAVLRPEDGAAKIEEIIPGGPAGRDSRDIALRMGDKIIGVGQDKGPVEDVLHLPLTQIVRKIRGKKGTRVVLNVVSASDASGTATRLVDLIRDDVKLEEQAATSHVATVTLANGSTRKLGVVRLPTFYGSMGTNPKDEGFRSCAADVARLVTQMSDEIDGLVLDLRNNGGGSLREAIDLTGRFIRLGPVVQVREIGQIHVLPDRDPAVTFRKPMVALVNRVSASASEIVAGALQDYGRAIVVGDSKTHGKGSVQTIMPLGSDAKLGSLKVTCASYYRVSGSSTQLRGVVPDLVIPSTLDYLDLGEDKLPNPMPWTRVPAADFSTVANLGRYVPLLATNSAGRLAKNPRYARYRTLVDHLREINAKTTLALDTERRRAQVLAEKEMSQNEETDREVKPGRPEDDVILEESLHILSDLVDLQKDAPLFQEGEATPEARDWLRRLFLP